MKVIFDEAEAARRMKASGPLRQSGKTQTLIQMRQVEAWLRLDWWGRLRLRLRTRRWRPWEVRP